MDAGPGYAIERLEHFATLPAGGKVVVRNPFGDVRARFGGYEGVVEVRPTIQHIDGESPPVEVALELRGSTLHVDVGVRARGPRSRLGGERQPGQRKRADLVLFVADGLDLEVEATDGFVQLRGLHGNVVARTGSGDVQVRSVRGDVDVSSRSGAIMVTLAGARPTTQRLRNDSGDTTLALHEDGHFDVTAEGPGWVSTDYSLQFEPVRGRGVRRARVQVNEATTPVAVGIGSGHLRIVRQPSAERSRVLPESEQ